MKTVLKYVPGILAILFTGIFTRVSAQGFNFKYYKIDEFKDRMGQTSLVDIDRDGDLDWVFGRFGNMYYYEYKSPENWELHEIGKGARTDVGGCAHDVNNDDWIDFVVGDSWYENTGKPEEENFILHKKNMISSHDNIAVDIDGDSIKDIVACSNHKDHPVLAWYKIPEDHSKNWEYHKIGEGIHGGISPHGYGDLDNDGDMDIVRGNYWYENLDSRGKAWKTHKNLIPPGGNRPDRYGLAIKTWCYDLDNDGDLDIIEAEADTPDGRVFWFENINNAQSFKFHPVTSASTNQDFHSLALADFDGDGDMDIASGGGPLSIDDYKLIIWENISGNGKSWKEHVILTGKQVHEMVAADVDKDGDIDLCSKPWDGGLHFYLENRLNE
jgi:hypothetical protein